METVHVMMRDVENHVSSKTHTSKVSSLKGLGGQATGKKYYISVRISDDEPTRLFTVCHNLNNVT